MVDATRYVETVQKTEDVVLTVGGDSVWIPIGISHPVHAQRVRTSKGNLRTSDVWSKVHPDMTNNNHAMILAEAANAAPVSFGRKPADECRTAALPALAEWSTS